MGTPNASDDALPHLEPARHCPPGLVAGDRVALISPAGPSPAETIDHAIALLTSWGLVPVLGDNARRTDARAPYLAGSDAERAADLRSAWLDESIRAVFCLRGGYGSMRLIDLLDFDELSVATPKLLIGSSDITALHQAWARHLDVVTMFTPMVATDAVLDDPVAAEGVHEILFRPQTVRAFSRDSAEALVPGTATGTLVGGNVSLIAASIGSPEFRLPDGAIGLIEEIHEEPYRLDLLLLELKRSGWLGALAGLALGSWEDCGDPVQIRELLTEYAVPLGIPVIWQLGFGHCRGALSLPLGAEARLISEEADPRIELVRPLGG